MEGVDWTKALPASARAQEQGELLARLMSAADRERREAERRLDADVQQRLLLAMLKLDALEKAEPASHNAQRLLDEVRSELRDAAGELRDVGRAVYPYSLHADGLAAALQAAVARWPTDVVVEGERIRCEAPEVETAAYFCVMRVLRELSEDSSQTIDVALRREGEALQIEIEQSADSAHRARDVEPGLQAAGDRAAAVGGRLEVGTTSAGGVRVSIALPADPADPE